MTWNVEMLLQPLFLLFLSFLLGFDKKQTRVAPVLGSLCQIELDSERNKTHRQQIIYLKKKSFFGDLLIKKEISSPLLHLGA